VVFGREALCGVGESQPYPSRYLAHYPRTKAIAEREVLEANDRDLATVALRPHLIWGPGDPHLIPRLLERARAGRLARIGDGQNLVDICFVENAADAHILAADGLGVGARCAGKAYFVSQGEPVRLWSWIDEILDVAGLPPVSRSVSAPVARGLARAMELTHSALGRRGEPLLTRFVVAQLSKTHYFCIGAARRDFGYSPRVSTATGMERLARWLRSSEPLAKEPM
jgi:nucleoside-diphosphate-sugar epimerase